MRFNQALATVNRGRIGDQSIKGNHGIVYGRPAAVLVAGTDEIDIDTEWDEFGGNAVAVIAARIYVDEAGGGTDVIYWDEWAAGGNERIKLTWEHGDNTLKVSVRSGATGDTARTASSSALTADAWHTILVAIDAANDNAHFFVDGAASETVALSGALEADAFAASVPDSQRIGAGNAAEFLDGMFTHFGLLGTSTVPTTLDSQKFYDDPRGWIVANCNMGLDFAIGTGVDLDDIVNSHDCTGTGIAWDLGENGGDLAVTAAGRVFDGVKNFVEIPNDPSLVIGTSDFQIHVWANLSSGAGAGPLSLFSKGNQQATGVWFFYNAGNLILFAIGGTIQATAGPDLRDDTWHLLSAFRDSAAEDACIAVDGVVIATDTSAAGNITHADPVTLGSSDAGGSTLFEGIMKTVRFATATKTLAQATLDALAIFKRGPNA